MFVFLDEKPEDVLAERTLFFRMGVHTAFYPFDDVATAAHLRPHAVILMHPNRLPDLEKYCDELRIYMPCSPLALCYREGEGNFYRYQRLSDYVFPEHVTSLTVAQTLFDLYAKINPNRTPWLVQYQSLKTEIGSDILSYVGQEAPLHRDEAMMAGYLIFRAPSPIYAEELQMSCFHPARLPKLTYVHKRFCRLCGQMKYIFGYPLFIYHPDYGYFVAPA